jgi:D-amino-acid dehydrogenase/Ca-activated chloride channel family protein
MDARKIYASTVLIPFLLLMGCAEDAKNKETVQPVTLQKEKKFIAANDPKGMVYEGPGKLGGKNYNEVVAQNELRKFSVHLSAKDVYTRLIQLFAFDYKPLAKELENWDTSIQMRGQKTPESSKLPTQEEIHTNVEILLDASGSMAGRVNGGTKMDLAKEAVQKFVENVPEGTRVSLRIYGHKGSNASKDKDISCKSSELVYPFDSYKAAEFTKSLKKFKPTGYTPLALAILQAKKDLEIQKMKSNGKTTKNIVYIVSDGIETCGGDPIKASQTLHNSEINAVVNIIGFDVDDAGQKALQAAAEAGAGKYSTVKSGEELAGYLEKEYMDLWSAWSEWGNTHWKDVSKQYWTKYHLLSDKFSMGGDFDTLAKQERERLQKAADFLLKQNIISRKTWINVDDAIIIRYHWIDQYYRTPLFKEKDRIMEQKKVKLQKEIELKTNEMQKKYY